MKFLAVMDPPWDADEGGGGRGAQNHYPLAGVDAIERAVRSAPPWRDVGDGLVWMWATVGALAMREHAKVPDAYRLVSALGFRVCAQWVWMKGRRKICELCEGAGLCDCPRCLDASAREPCRCCKGLGYSHFFPEAPGLGQWSRCGHEHLLLCRRGDAPVPPPNARPHSVIIAPTSEHSAKPPEAWDVIERVSRGSLGTGVRGCEYFARTVRPGWDAWGHLGNTDVAEVRHG